MKINHIHDTQTKCHYLDIGKRIRIIRHEYSEYLEPFGFASFSNVDMLYCHIVLFCICFEFHFYKRYFD